MDLRNLIIQNCPGLKDLADVIHGDLTQQHRSQVGKDFSSGKLLLLICTAAFEMGIDKSDLKRCIIYDKVLSIESSEQRRGRVRSHDTECEIIYMLNQVAMTKDKTASEDQANEYEIPESANTAESAVDVDAKESKRLALLSRF